MFDNLFGIAKGAIQIISAPVDAVLSVVNDGVEAIAEVVEDLAEDVKGITK